MKKSIKQEIFTIPNILSAFRIVLAFLIPYIYWKPDLAYRMQWLLAIIALSALTDFLDGKIARKFHMISEVGKILDPIADKLTQGLLLICLISRTSLAKIILILFLIKEVMIGGFGLVFIRKTGKNEGAKWYGKVNTAVFYTIVMLLIFLPELSKNVVDILLGICGGCMLCTFVLYMNQFRKANEC